MSSHSLSRLPAITVAAAVHLILAATSSAALADAPPPGVEAANGNTQVYLNPNGVPIVNIANPNAAGVSHNQYTQFNVDSRGVVLNNGTVDQITRNSQLAGQTFSNLNLSSSASLILNEVTSPNRSVLAGFTEVLGAQADVIIANPYGITCNGCGFINTPRVALTTGSPNFGANGALTGFSVNGGDVLISGAGLNGTNQDYFDIVTRSLRVDGQVNANQLSIVTGANAWDYGSGEALNTGGAGAPAYAFDSTALGGIYADRIRILATDQGVGVRSLGEMAATAADFRIDAAGRVELGGRISAAGDIGVRDSGSAVGEGGIAMSGAAASLSAGQNLTLTSDNAAISLSGGMLTAGGDLSVSGTSIDDVSDEQSVRFGNTTSVWATGGVNIAGATWGATQTLAVTGSSVSLDGATLYSRQDRSDLAVALRATSGDITLRGGSSVSSIGRASLTAAGGVEIADADSSVRAINVSIGADTSAANAGTVIAVDAIDVIGTSEAAAPTFENSGHLQAGGLLNLTTASITNTAAGTILGQRVLLSTGALTNAGRIQGTIGSMIHAESLSNAANATLHTSTVPGGFDVLEIAGALTNDGTLHAGANIGISASSIDNAAGATMSAGGNLLVSAADSATNAGMMNGGNELSLRAMNVTNSGQVQSGSGMLVINGPSAGRLANLEGGTIVSGERLFITAGTLENAGTLQGTTTGRISVGTLDNQTAAARIITSTQQGGPLSTITVGDLTNAGAIHSVGDLTVASFGTTANGSTGGLSSLGSLRLETASSVENHGSIYAGSELFVGAGGAFVNVGTVDGNGTVVAGIPGSGVGNMTFDVDSFLNTGTVLAEGNVGIDARVFRNDPIGDLPTIVSTSQLVRDLAGNPVIETIGASPGINCNIVLGNDCAYNWVKYATYVVTDGLSGAPPTPAQLLAGGDFTLSYSGSARNVASIIAADNITILGEAGSSAFENNDLHLTQRIVHKRFSERIGDEGHQFWVPVREDHYNIPDMNGDNPGVSSGWVAVANFEAALTTGYFSTFSSDIIEQYDAGLYARESLNLTGLVNRSQNRSASVEATIPNAIEASGTNVPGAASAQGINLRLPTSPNGFFVSSQSPDSDYLIETNPLFTSGTALGSDYLASLLGYDAETLQKRLGDANYEEKLIRDQLIAQTGRNILTGYASESAQVKGLMESAAGQAGDLGLTFGKALSPEQVAGLKQDLVWMEEKVVGGRTVLVPVVYLAASTREGVVRGAVVSATNIDVRGDKLINEGTITADKKLNVETSGDIVNRSGTISGGTVDLKAGGDVINETAAAARGDSAVGNTDIGGTARIIAKDGLTIDAGRDVVVKGAEVSAGGNAAISARGNVSIDTIQDRNASTSAQNRGTGMSSTNTQSVTQIGSKVNAGGGIDIQAGQDVTVGGSSVSAGGDANVRAGGNVNILDRRDETLTHTVEASDGGLTTKGASIGRSTETTEVTTTSSTSVGSSITSGGSTRVDAGGTATVRGSDIAAGGNLDVNAKDINVIAGESTSSETRREEESFTGVGVYADKNSTGWEAVNETETRQSKETTGTARTSTLKAGGDVNRNASGTIRDVGTQIEAGGNVTQSATEIDNRAAANTHTLDTSTEKERISVGQSIDYGVGDAIDDAEKGSTSGAVQAAGGPTAGSNIKYRKETSQSSESSSQAVVGTIKAGGNVQSRSSGTTTLEGTQIQSGGDTTLEAGKLDAKAAADTTTSSSSSEYYEAKFRGEVDVSGKPGATVSGGYGFESEGSKSSTAVTGSVTSGGNVTVRTTGDARFEGTNVKSKGDTTIEAGGDVTMDAARDTSQSASNSLDVSTSVSVANKSVGGSFEFETSNSNSRSDQAVTGTVEAGGNLTVKSGKDVKVEGADLEAGNDATISADGKVEMKDAVSTSESRSESVSVSGTAEVSMGGKGGKGGNKSHKGNRRTQTKDGEDMVMGGGGASAESQSTSETTTKKATVQDKNTKPK